jgi:hypothetical protein
LFSNKLHKTRLIGQLQLIVFVALISILEISATKIATVK